MLTQKESGHSLWNGGSILFLVKNEGVKEMNVANISYTLYPTHYYTVVCILQ